MARFPSFSVLALLLALLVFAPQATAQEPGSESVTVVDSSPRANTVFEAGIPDTLTTTFSAEIDPTESKIRLLDETGDALANAAIDWDGATAMVGLPDDLSEGTWLVAWDVTAETGAEGSGFYGFTVGADQDVAPLTLPETGFEPSNGPAWLARIATGALVLGTLVLIAIWPVWTLLRRSDASPSLTRASLQSLATLAAGVAVLGALARLAAEAWSAPPETWFDGLMTVLENERSGWVLLASLVLVSLHSVLMALLPSRPTGALPLLPWFSTVALAAPIALLSHAADEPAGRLPTLIVTIIALLVLGVLMGGTLSALWLRALPPAGSRLVVAIGGIVLLLAGAYLAWLFIGNGTALRRTTYGVLASTTVVVAIAFLLALAGIIILARPRWLLAPALLAIVLAGLIGSLMVEDTARTELEREATQRALPIALGDDRAQVILAPGATGVNHVRLEVNRASLPQQTEAWMTLALPSEPELGAQTIQLSRVNGPAFEYHGSELAIAGDWELNVMLAEPGQPLSDATTRVDLDQEVANVDVPGTPWRYTAFAGSTGMLLVAIAVAALIIGLAAGRSPLRMESVGLGAMALVLAAILLSQGRLDPILAAGGAGAAGAINPDDLALVTRGEDVYETYCLTCHGPELRGDGPASAGMQPPPADFSAPHTMVHDEATLIYWLRNGKQGTAMPAFGSVLTDDEIRAVLSYIEREQRDFATPAP